MLPNLPRPWDRSPTSPPIPPPNSIAVAQLKIRDPKQLHTKSPLWINIWTAKLRFVNIVIVGSRYNISNFLKVLVGECSYRLPGSGFVRSAVAFRPVHFRCRIYSLSIWEGTGWDERKRLIAAWHRAWHDVKASHGEWKTSVNIASFWSATQFSLHETRRSGMLRAALKCEALLATTAMR